ncbi:MAG TPA: heme ABC exporter ATP-binding protein CcmA [Stellaceae bacterium]|nr:heme ABC exporter ATP-binding protein CcmA [Stellaceae bacterium]
MKAAACDLAAEGIACRRGERLVFAGLSFRLMAGGALVLVGSNGSGKTSLLRLVATLIEPAAGRLVWDGRPVAADRAAYRAQLAYVGHQDAVKPALSPRETLRFWAALRGLPPRRSAPLIEAALAGFALEAVADWPCRWLSAGQRRRLALARLIAAPAPIWLLDEPTSGLDHDNQTRLEAAVAAHRDGGGRVLLATHLPLALAAADSLVLDDFAPGAGDPERERALAEHEARFW